jgi:hypothetical protein
MDLKFSPRPVISRSLAEGGCIDQTFDWPGKPHSAGTRAIRGSGLIRLAMVLGLRSRVIPAMQSVAPAHPDECLYGRAIGPARPIPTEPCGKSPGNVGALALSKNLVRMTVAMARRSVNNARSLPIHQPADPAPNLKGYPQPPLRHRHEDARSVRAASGVIRSSLGAVDHGNVVPRLSRASRPKESHLRPLRSQVGSRTGAPV